jgi:hypothetical protein
MKQCLYSFIVDELSESQLLRLGKIFIKSTDIEQLLNDNKIDYMLIGAHALGELTCEPRATQDVDIIIHKQDFQKTINLILKTYPNLTNNENRIEDKTTKQSVVDILTDEHPIYKTAFSARNGKLPKPEMMLVMKFLSSNSPLRRKDKKIQDKADFFNVAFKKNIDKELVFDLLKKADPQAVFYIDKIKKWIREAKE